MRKLIYSVFVAFWAVIGTLLLLQGLTEPGPEESPSTAAAATDQPLSTVEEQRYSLEEIARHDRLDDCWMAIGGGVYSITDYVSRHPAPDEVLVPWCGREATEGMQNKGRGRDHSARAWRMLERYRIGTLVEVEVEVEPEA